MKFGKVIFFIIILMFTTAQIYSQGAAAKWDPPVISVSHTKIIAGNTIEVSATIKVLNNVRGLKYKAGIDRYVMKQQTFPGQLNAGTTIPVKFSWTAVRGKHKLFFRLILPGNTPPGTPTKLRKTINVIPRIQTPSTNPNLSMGTNIPQDPCIIINRQGTNDVVLESLDVVSVANNLATINVKIWNNGNRCIKELCLQIRLNEDPYETLLLGSDYFVPGSKWLLKAGKRVTWVGSINRPKKGPPLSNHLKVYIEAVGDDATNPKFNTNRSNDIKSTTIIW